MSKKRIKITYTEIDEAGPGKLLGFIHKEIAKLHQFSSLRVGFTDQHSLVGILMSKNPSLYLSREVLSYMLVNGKYPYDKILNLPIFFAGESEIEKFSVVITSNDKPVAAARFYTGWE